MECDVSHTLQIVRQAQPSPSSDWVMLNWETETVPLLLYAQHVKMDRTLKAILSLSVEQWII